MKTKTIADLAYTINYCKRHNKPMPIILCGAGISKTAGIPLTGQIIQDVFDKFSGKPEIEKLKYENCMDYYKIMRALRAEERQDLFKEYIESDAVRLNLASIYIAQLLKEKYVDFVFTVNFDDVLLKASALFNFIPPIYDLANMSGLNSNNFVKNSLVYLHGQYFGQWLLNTEDEIEKGLSNVHNLFQRECNRPWIVVGYSGEDEVFQKLNEIPSFSSDLYWVSYDDNTIKKEVMEQLLKPANKNAYAISNIDADTFFLELCTELKLQHPPIFDKPFTFLETYFDKIQDFKSPSSKFDILYQNLSKQKEISLNWIKKAKTTIENSTSLAKLQQEIIDAILKKDFSEEKGKIFEDEINTYQFNEAKEQLFLYFGEWGNTLYNLDNTKQDENLLEQSIEKYHKAIELNPSDDTIYNNWGTALNALAKIKQDENLFKQSFDKYHKANELNPSNDLVYINWGNALSNLARIKQDENLFQQSFDKYQKSSELKSYNDSIYNNWGNAISDLAEIKQDENLFQQSFEKYQKASKLNPENDAVYSNWGIALSNLAEINQDENLFYQSFDKFKKAAELNPNAHSVYYNWGSALSRLSKLKKDEAVLNEAETVLIKGIHLGSKKYNLACCYALQKKKENALNIIQIALENKEITSQFVENDSDWESYKNDEDFIALLAKY
jgi:tetratricopeptide (TPR) repeat protein